MSPSGENYAVHRLGIHARRYYCGAGLALRLRYFEAARSLAVAPEHQRVVEPKHSGD